MLRSVSALAAAAVLACAVPASADDAALKTAMANAWRGVRSFTVEMSGPNGMAGTSVVVVAPQHRVKSTMAIGPMTIDSVAAGSVVYVSANGQPWQARTLSADATAGYAKSLADSSDFTVLPDRTEDGKSVAVVRVAATSPLPGMAGRRFEETCSVDRVTHLPLRCTTPIPNAPAGEELVLRFGGWNDPKNVVEIPKDAPSPSPLVLPSAPAASPSPRP